MSVPKLSGLVVAFVAFLVIVGAMPARADDKAAEIVLGPGEQRALPGAGVDAVSASGNDVIDVRIVKAETSEQQPQILIVGKAPGRATLLVVLTNGRRLEYVVTVTQIRARHNVRLDVYFVELSQNAARQIGVAWPGSVAANASASGTAALGASVTGQLTVTSSVIPRLDFAAEHGWARVLEHAKVVMANGDEGTFSSGGELNFRVANGLNTSLEKIPFGSRVTARVSFDPISMRVEVRVKASVDKVTSSRGADAPGVSRTSVDTTANLGLGESLALGGLFSTAEVNGRSGLPLLKDIPVLGYLFGTRSRTVERRENVLFIVPTLVSPVSAADRDRVLEALRVYASFDGDGLGTQLFRLASDRPADSKERKR